MTVTGDFERFQYFYFETKFLKNYNFFKKLKYRFIVESTTIETAIIPWKTVMSKANVKTNSMESTEWTYLKERSFVTNYFLFFGNLIWVQEPHINSRFNGPITQMSTCILFLSARVLFEALYSLRVSLRIPACVAHSSFLLQLGDGEYKVWVHIFR